jgi:hypothetical protein
MIDNLVFEFRCIEFNPDSNLRRKESDSYQSHNCYSTKKSAKRRGSSEL